MIDSKQIVYLPLWVKLIAIMLLAGGLAVGTFVSLSFIGVPDRTDWILLALSGTQFAATGLMFAIIIFFGERDSSVKDLMGRSDDFLAIHVRNALASVSLSNGHVVRCEVGDRRDIFGRHFVLTSDDVTMRLWVGINVRRIFVIYFVRDMSAETDYIARLKDCFKFTLGGAEQVGFKAHYERASVQGEPIVSIWLSAEMQPHTLTDPAEKLFWAQDVAMMSESFLRTAIRNNIRFDTEAPPAPL